MKDQQKQLNSITRLVELKVKIINLHDKFMKKAGYTNGLYDAMNVVNKDTPEQKLLMLMYQNSFVEMNEIYFELEKANKDLENFENENKNR